MAGDKTYITDSQGKLHRATRVHAVTPTDIVWSSNPNDYTVQVKIGGKWHRAVLTMDAGAAQFFDNVNIDKGLVVGTDGKTHTALIVKPESTVTLSDIKTDTHGTIAGTTTGETAVSTYSENWSDVKWQDNVNVYKVLVTGSDGKVHTALLTTSAGGGGVQVIVLGPSPLSLPNAIANSLSYVKAFGGTEQRNLPDNYVERQYIYMLDGAYIRVEDLPISAGYKVEFDFQTTSLGSSLRNYLGGRAPGVSAGGGFRLSKLASGGTNLNRVVLYGFETGTEYYDPTTQFTANTRYKYTYNNGVCILESGGSVISTNTFTLTDNTSTDWGINDYCSNGGWSAYHDGLYVYSVKVWNDQGELVMDLVPAVQKGAVPVVGFYDAATGGFRGPTGGTFAAGPEVVPTPDKPIDIVSNNGVLKARHQSGLPLGYQLLSSLTSDGRCLVDTGVVLQDGDEIDLDYSLANPQPSSLPADRFLFGTANVDTSKGGTWAEVYSGSGDISSAAWYVRFSSPASVNGNLPATTLSGHLTLKQEQLIINDVTVLTPGYVGTFQTTSLTFFGRYDATLPGYKGAKMTASHFTVKNGNAYRFNGVMVKRLSDNALGVYDFVSGTFCENIGDGTFTAGDPVNDPVIAYADGTVETIKDSLNNTATCEDLLAFDTDHTDEQEIKSGTVTRKVSVLVLTGDEDGWVKGNNVTIYNLGVWSTPVQYSPDRVAIYCTHYVGTDATNANSPDKSIKLSNSSYFSGNGTVIIKDSSCADLAAWKAFLKSQYLAGTPVIAVLPAENTTTESVPGQTLEVQNGNNTLEITQASLAGLELEAEYTKVA